AYQNTGKVQLAIADYRKALNLSQDKPEYSRIKADASKRLQESQTNTTLPQSPAPPKIYLLYQDAKDRDLLEKIGAALNGQSNYKLIGLPADLPGYRVAGKPEKVTQATTGDVRYFHKEDESLATRVKQFVENMLKANRTEKTLELRPLLRQGNRVPQ